MERIISEKEIDINPADAFLFASSSWLHDIGMAINQKVEAPSSSEPIEKHKIEWINDVASEDGEGRISDKKLIRKWHHILSWNFIRKNSEMLNLEQPVANLIADICKVHRRIEETSCLEEVRELQISGKHVRLHPQAVAGFLQLTDALDTNLDRAPKFYEEQIKDIPVDSRKHWQACQLIEDFDFDSTENLITLHSRYRNDNQKNLFLKKLVRDLYEEYEDVERILNSPPYQMFLVDIECKAKHVLTNEISVLRGKEEYIEKMTKEAQETTKKQATDFRDTLDTYRIYIHNLDGDVTIEREIETEFINPEVSGRVHHVTSYDNSEDWDWNEDIESKDGKDRTLNVKKIEDRPTHKRFKIGFPEGVDREKPYVYFYKFRWDEFFPREEEIFNITSNSNNISILLDFPLDMEIEKIWAVEAYPDGTNIKREKKFIEVDGNTYKCNLEKDRRTDIEIRWKRR